ncbi:MAG: ATP-binding protein, partial [Phaeodactylibacter sp.]|nr:ATP-binding protein [Phaeodactylibacter sp.]
GWARPVRDTSATLAAAHLYKALSSGASIPKAMRSTLGKLLSEEKQYPGWHLLRLYLNGIMPGNLIEKGRYQKPTIQLDKEFLDPATKQIKVPSRADFIGRRRKIQHCLRVLRTEPSKAGVLIYGMGGLGKSSLAARLRTRLHDSHLPIVWVGKLDQSDFERKLTEQLETEAQRAAIQSSNEALRFRLKNAFAQQAGKRLLFIFDDFEQNMEQDAQGKPILDSQGQPRLKPQVVALLNEILAAVQSQQHNQAPQLMITCRYALQAGFAQSLEQIPLTHFQGSEWERLQRKKMDGHSSTQKARIESIADGNPRLLEWLLEVVAEIKDQEVLLEKLEEKEAEFRADILAEHLLEQQSTAFKKVLHRLSTFERPIPLTVLEKLVDDPDLRAHLQLAQRLSLVDFHAQFYGKKAGHYRVAEVIKTLLPEVDKAQFAQAAEVLYGHWNTERYSEEQALEMLRLGLSGEQEEVTLKIGGPLGATWVNNNQYYAAKQLCKEILRTYPNDFQTLLNLGRAEIVLGEVVEAEKHLENAKNHCPLDKEEILSSISYWLAYIFRQRGQVDKALQLYQEASQIFERIGDEKGKSATLHSMAYIFLQRGQVDKALQLYQDSLAIKERIGDEQGKANTSVMLAQLVAYEKRDFETGIQLMNYAVQILTHLRSAELEAVQRDRNKMFLKQIEHELGPAKYQEFLALLDKEGGDTAIAWWQAQRKELPPQ